MSDFLHRIVRPWPVPAMAIILLTASAIAGNLAQFDQKQDLKSQADLNNAESECRGRIVGYVEGLSIELSIAETLGLLDQVGAEDLPLTFEEAVDAATSAALRLNAAKDYRERSVEVCAANPNFNPTRDIPEPETP